MGKNEVKICEVCFRHCYLSEGQTGFCHARKNEGGEVVPACYGMVTSLALDPIEKKPLYHFYPGSMIVSVGGYGCNFSCPFCQNVEISLADRHGVVKRNEGVNGSDYFNSDNGADAKKQESDRGRKDIEIRDLPPTKYYSPEEVADICAYYVKDGNIGIAFTYNEPLVDYEFVRDTAKLVKEMGMKTALVTNGSATTDILDEIGPWIDAMNIDLKSFNEDYYRKTLGGDLFAVKAFIERALTYGHVEVTTLVIPGENDSDEEMRNISVWLNELENKYDKKIPLHISRFFGRSLYSGRRPTPVETVYHLADVAREYLEYVHEGNV